MAIIIARHIGPAAGSGAASVAASCQRVVGSCSTCRRERSRIVAVWHSLSESNGSAAGGDGAVRNPLQEVEQDHGYYCDLPRGVDLLIEARQR